MNNLSHCQQESSNEISSAPKINCLENNLLKR